MAESVSGGNQPPKEMSMEARLVIAFILMGAVMWLTPYLFKSAAPPPAPKKTEQPASTVADAGGAKNPVPAPPAASEPAPATPSGAPTTAATAQQPQPPLIIDTDLF